jgi:hypothetical protein
MQLIAEVMLRAAKNHLERAPDGFYKMIERLTAVSVK